MADTQRTVGVKVKTTSEGTALQDAADELGKLEQAAAEVTPPLDKAAGAARELDSALEGIDDSAAAGLREAADAAGELTDAAGGAATAAEEIGAKAKSGADGTQMLSGEMRDLVDVATLAGVAMSRFMPWMVALGAAKLAYETVQTLTDKMNELAVATGQAEEPFVRFLGLPILNHVQKTADAMVSLRMAVDDQSGATRDQIKAHEQAREAFLATRTAADELTGAVESVTEAQKGLAAAAKAAAEEQAAISAMLEESAQRTREEIAKNEAAASADQAKRDAERLKRQEETAAADAAAIERVAAAHRLLMEAVSQPVDTSGIDALNASVEQLGATCDATFGKVMALFQIDPETGTGMGSEDRAQTMRDLLDARVAGMRGGGG